MIEIYGTPKSRAFRVYWVMEELGLTYKSIPITPGKESHSAEFLKLNPNGKVPALKEGDFILFESAAICYYLCTKSPKQTLVPKEGTKERALVDQWMFWCMSELEQAPWAISKHSYVYPEQYRTANALDGPKYEFANYEKVLLKTLNQNKYLLGDHYTLADIFVAHTLNWANSMGLVSEERLKEYAKTLKELPSFNKAKALLKQ